MARTGCVTRLQVWLATLATDKLEDEGQIALKLTWDQTFPYSTRARRQRAAGNTRSCPRTDPRSPARAVRGGRRGGRGRGGR